METLTFSAKTIYADKNKEEKYYMYLLWLYTQTAVITKGAVWVLDKYWKGV